MNELIHKTLHPEVKIVGKGKVTYVASDESVDSDREIVRVAGWRFNYMKKNGPFLNTHRKDSIEDLLGKVVDFRLENIGGRPAMVNDVEWAIDVPENKLAQLGWKMTEAGYLKAVSAGFLPVSFVTKHDSGKRGEWQKHLGELKVTEARVWRIFTEQEQKELSACILGANSNALVRNAITMAKAFKEGVLNEAELEWISQEQTKGETANSAICPAEAEFARRRAREEFLDKIEAKIKSL